MEADAIAPDRVEQRRVVTELALLQAGEGDTRLLECAGMSLEDEAGDGGSLPAMRVCIVGASGKLGQYMVQHALDRSYQVVGVCREQSVGKLDGFKGRITVVPGATDDAEVIKKAVAECDAVLVVLVPRGVHGYSTGTAQAVLDYARPGARLVFSSGWHISLDGQDVYSWRLKALVKFGGWPGASLASPTSTTR